MTFKLSFGNKINYTHPLSLYITLCGLSELLIREWFPDFGLRFLSFISNGNFKTGRIKWMHWVHIDNWFLIMVHLNDKETHSNEGKIFIQTAAEN